MSEDATEPDPTTETDPLAGAGPLPGEGVTWPEMESDAPTLATDRPPTDPEAPTS
jgi:hypothetical protein